MKTLYIVLLAVLAVSLSGVGSAYAVLDVKIDVFDYNQRVLTPSEIAILSHAGHGDFRGFDLIVMDSRIELRDKIDDWDMSSSNAVTLYVLDGDDVVSYSPSTDVSTINISCPSVLPGFPKDVPTGVFLCYLVPSGSVPLVIQSALDYCVNHVEVGNYNVASEIRDRRTNCSQTVEFAPDPTRNWASEASYTLDLIQDVHVPILQSTIYFDDLEQLFLVFDRSVRVNDIDFVSLYFGANSTYTFERADVVGSSSGQVLRLNTTSHNLSYTDAAVVLQQDAFISTVDENNVYNSEAILPIIRVR